MAQVLAAQTLGSLLAEASAALSAAGFAEPRRQARRLVASALAISPTELLGQPDQVANGQQTTLVRETLRRVCRHEPLSRVLGRREFWGLDFALSPETLDPRPETETLVEAVLKRKSERQAPLRFLDLGTGTGCLLLALLHEFPVAIGIGIDNSESAVATATYNAAALGCADRALFFVGDWGTALSGRFDVVVSNPPYIESGELALLPREVACYDPSAALDGGEDGLGAYRSIGAQLAALLASDGIFAVEIGAGQADAAAAVLTASGLAFDAIEEDLAGIARCLIMRLRRTRSR